MLSKKNIFVLLFPIVYLIHNIEEWLVFSAKKQLIIPYIPNQIISFLSYYHVNMVSVFGMALVVATIIPVILSFFIWGKFTALNAKILLIIAFVTLINAISHVISSASIGFISPGLFSGIILCVPYGIAFSYFIISHFLFNVRQFIFLSVASIVTYLLGIIISLLLAMIYLRFVMI